MCIYDKRIKTGWNIIDMKGIIQRRRRSRPGMTRDCWDISGTVWHQNSRDILLWCSTKSDQSGQRPYRPRVFSRTCLGMSAGSCTDNGSVLLSLLGCIPGCILGCIPPGCTPPGCIHSCSRSYFHLPPGDSRDRRT